MKLWKYKNYDEYVKVQTEGNLNKLKNVWARQDVFDKIATNRQKFLLNLQKKNLEKDITSYNIEDKDKEEYNLIEKEEESKLKINNNNIFDKLKMRIKEDKGVTK